MQDGRYTLSPAETQQLLAQLDLTAAGDITFSEWVASLMDWTKLHESSDWDGLVERAFLALNTDGSGLLTMAELELILCGEEGCQVPDELHAALREADLGHCVDEGIGLEQFRALLAGQLQDRLDLFETRLGKPGNSNSL